MTAPHTPAERETLCPCCGQRTQAPNGFTLFSLASKGGSFIETVCTPGFETPRRLGNGNIHFPAGWSEADRRTWRVMMDEPGAEYDRSQGACS